MARTQIQDGATWDTVHRNGPYPTKILYKTNLESDSIMPDKIDRYNDAAIEIQRLLQQTIDAGESFRAFGARWSLSNVAYNTQRMHFNENMNIKISVQKPDMHKLSTYKSEDLFFVQCGNKIKEITEYIKREGKSLKTCGASNGQTIGGAIATGVHGSALTVGSVQDSIVGINLLIGPGKNDNVYLERETKPALRDAFAKKINARIIRDDKMFNAALVGLGAFGFIHGVVLEAENLYLLNRYVRKVNKTTALQLAEQLNFKDVDLKIPGEVNNRGKFNEPYHYKIFINPYNNVADYVVEIIYKKPYRTDYVDPIPRIQTSLYKDLILVFGKIAAACNNKIPKMIKLLESDILPKVDDDVTGTLGEIFDDAINQGPAFACSFGVDHRQSARALEVMMDVARKEGPVPGIFAMRFVKGSAATLAFTKYPVTCMIEIDGVLWKGNKKMISLDAFGRKIIEALISQNIDFTIHWGKNADWAFPDLVKKMYGNKLTLWKQQRRLLLNDEAIALFGGEFLKDTGLDTP